MLASLRTVARSAPPKLSGFALWLLEHWHEIAFSSIRGLAHKADVDPNLVTRLSRELGYDGFDAFRDEVRQLLQSQTPSYGARARALQSLADADVYSSVIAANRENLDRVTSPAGLQLIDSCITPLLEARRIYSIGVRCCYSVAHYMSYVGNMAFENFEPVPQVPGAILDQVSGTTPEDIVIGITYEHYSSEVVRACQIARDRGARILALTDSHNSPIAVDAWKVIRLPMTGPHLMPSLNSAFLVVELILAAMTARSTKAATQIAQFEERISGYGGYVRS